ncbi:hypothetical protein BYT27DRAFT_7131492 [Phlegmacium glaucopus]|nr:hypothetical protein BYT27DRAFT_7131492 [Phlegmacium glaucopus]
MSALLGKAGKKLFAKHLEKYAPEDPLYEFYTNNNGKQKRRKRQLPPGLSARDAAILRSIKKRAHYLDKGFSLCGMQFGWTFVIGLVPIAGDVANAALNYHLVVRKARNADLPDWLVGRMLINNALSAGVGFIPLIGDVLLAVYKANSRNAALLEEYLRIRGDEFLKMREAEAKREDLSPGGDTTTMKGDLSAADVKQVKPGSGMTPSEKARTADDYSQDTGVLPASSTRGGASTRGLFGMRTKKVQQPAAVASSSNSSPKGRFVENVDLQEASK